MSSPAFSPVKKSLPPLSIPIANSKTFGTTIFPEEIEERKLDWRALGLTCPQCAGSLDFVAARSGNRAYFMHDSSDKTHKLENCPLYTGGIARRATRLQSEFDDAVWKSRLSLPSSPTYSRHWLSTGIDTLYAELFPGPVEKWDSEQARGRATNRKALFCLLGLPRPGQLPVLRVSRTRAVADVPDATKLLRQHPAITTLDVVGYGLRTRILVEAATRNQYLAGESARLWLLAAVLYRKEFRQRHPSKEVPAWLDRIIGGKNPEVEGTLQEMLGTGAFPSRMQPVVAWMARLLLRFPFVEACKDAIAELHGAVFTNHVSQIYLMTKSDDPRSVKVGKAGNPWSRAKQLSAGQMHDMSVLDCALCLDWRTAETFVRNGLTREAGGIIVKEYIRLPEAFDLASLRALFQAEAKRALLLQLSVLKPDKDHSPACKSTASE